MPEDSQTDGSGQFVADMNAAMMSALTKGLNGVSDSAKDKKAVAEAITKATAKAAENMAANLAAQVQANEAEAALEEFGTNAGLEDESAENDDFDGDIDGEESAKNVAQGDTTPTKQGEPEDILAETDADEETPPINPAEEKSSPAFVQPDNVAAPGSEPAEPLSGDEDSEISNEDANSETAKDEEDTVQLEFDGKKEKEKDTASEIEAEPEEQAASAEDYDAFPEEDPNNQNEDTGNKEAEPNPDEKEGEGEDKDKEAGEEKKEKEQDETEETEERQGSATSWDTFNNQLESIRNQIDELNKQKAGPQAQIDKIKRKILLEKIAKGLTTSGIWALRAVEGIVILIVVFILIITLFISLPVVGPIVGEIFGAIQPIITALKKTVDKLTESIAKLEVDLTDYQNAIEATVNRIQSLSHDARMIANQMNSTMGHN